MAPAHVTLRRLTAEDIDDVVDLAARDALPADVMPRDDDPDPSAWTPARRRRLAEFLGSRLRRLPDGRYERSFLIHVDARVVGVARLVQPAQDGACEFGLWVARSHRGRGIGDAAVRRLGDRARDVGGTALVADTTTGNAAALAVLRRHGAVLTPRRRAPGIVDACVGLG